MKLRTEIWRKKYILLPCFLKILPWLPIMLLQAWTPLLQTIKGIFPTACLTLRSSAITFSCSFQRITETDCSFDSLDKSKSLDLFVCFFYANCPKDISNHCSHWSFSGVTAESELIVARVGIYREKETQRLRTICPHHRRELRLGWRWNSSKCTNLIPRGSK